MPESISNGREERLRVYLRLLLFVYLVVFAVFVFLQDGLSPTASNPRDFVAFYVVASLAGDGELASAYDRSNLTVIYESLGKPGLDLPWFYPPHFSLVTLWFPYMPYWADYLVFGTLGLALFLACLQFINLGSKSRHIALIAPAVFLNLLFGQTGLIVAGLFYIGLAAPRRHWLLAGLALGVLTIKPHLGLLIPVVIIARRQWAVFLTAAVTAIALCLLSAAVFGFNTWHVFLFEALSGAMNLAARGELAIVLTAAPFAGLTLVGAPFFVAGMMQVLVIFGLAAYLVCLVRAGTPADRTAAAAAVAALIAAPHSVVYDWVLTVPALALIMHAGLSDRFLRWELGGVIALLVAPFFVLVFQSFGLPLAPFTAFALLALFARRLHVDRCSAIEAVPV